MAMCIIKVRESARSTQFYGKPLQHSAHDRRPGKGIPRALIHITLHMRYTHGYSMFSPETEPSYHTHQNNNGAADRCFLITHAHLDHVSSLVLSAGSLRGPARRIYAARETLEDIETIFSDRCWPKLASWKDDDPENALVYSLCDANIQMLTLR